MYKYKKFLIFFSVIAILLLWCCFPISFDNNDDQAMFVISSGFMSGVSSPNIILSNLLVGKLLTFLFSLFNGINWYTLYLQILLFACIISIVWFFIKDNTNSVSKSISTILILLLFFGIFSVYVVNIQFTMIAFMCVFVALFYLQSSLANRIKLPIIFVYLCFAVLVRKDVLFVFIAFSLPILISKIKQKQFMLTYSIVVVFIVFIFGISTFVNSNNSTYKQQETYNTIKAIDIIAANPIQVDTNLLYKNNFTKEDITLIQSWFIADNNYLTGNKIVQLATQLKSYRNIDAAFCEFKKFMLDERYLIVFYILTFGFVFFVVKNMRAVLLMNLCVFIILISYLIFAARLPHRVSFPILTYLVFSNLFYLIQVANKEKLKTILLSVLLLFATYKFYCTLGLYKLQTEYHSIFDNNKAEINEHPEVLFIGLDGFPIQFMNAWQLPSDGFPAHNIILSGWYAGSSDYQQMLAIHHLKNLTSDLRFKDNVLFLTNSTTLQEAYINVMRQRYSIPCHFEDVLGFKFLRPKKLVFDN